MAESTQKKYPWRASIRTGGAVAIAALTAAAAAGPLIADFVAEQFPGTPAAAVTLAVVVFVSGLSTLVNRLILLAPVAALFQKIGLGPVPKAEGIANNIKG